MSMPAVEENVVPSNESSQISLSCLDQDVVPSNTSSQISLNCLAQNVEPSDKSSVISLYNLTQQDPIQAFSESTEHRDDDGPQEENSRNEDDTDTNDEMLDDTLDSIDVTDDLEREGNRSSIENSTTDACFEALMKSSRNDFATNLVRHADMLSHLVTKCDDRTGDTLLHKAARYLDRKSCRRLLKKNARKNKPNRRKALPLHSACEGPSSSNIDPIEEKEVITSLITDDQESLKWRNTSGLTPLHIAAMRGSKSKCKAIAEHIISRRDRLEMVTDTEKRTPLHTAVIYKKNNVVKYMYRKNNDFGYASARDEKNRTPLDVACELGFYETVKCILELTKTTDLYGAYETPLVLAIENNHPEVMDLLLENGATCNSPNPEGQSALHMAMKQKDIMMFKRVLDNGADVGFQDVVKAIELGGVDILEEIWKRHPKSISEESNGITINTILHEAVKSNRSKELVSWMKEKHEGTLKDFIQKSVTIDDKKDKKDKTPLGLAAEKHKPETVKLLLEILPDSPLGSEERSPSASQFDVANTFKEALRSQNRDVVSGILESKFWRIALTQGDLTVNEDKPRVLRNPPPLRTLLETMPDLAEKALWKCIYVEEDTQNEENGGESNTSVDSFDIGNCQFDFSFIDDTYTDYYIEKCGVEAQTRYHTSHNRGPLTNFRRYYETDTSKAVIRDEHPLMYMMRATNKQHKDGDEKSMTLIKHPLILVLIRHMWGRSVPFYMAFLLFYMSFTILLSAYMAYGLHVQPPYLPTGENTVCNTQYHNTDLGLKIVTGLLWGAGVCLELVLAGNQIEMYLKFHNISYWVVYIGTIAVIVPNHGGCKLPTEWQWPVGALTVLGAWLNVLFLLGWLPVIGIYVNMIKVIFQTFLKFAVLWVVAVVSFALPHHILFYNQGPFTNLWVSSVKTAVMAFGEFDYTSIFHGEGTETVHYKYASRIIFVIFMAIMTMIIMNMMIALAVDDVGSLLKQGEIMKHKLIIDMALSVDLALPRSFRKRIPNYRDTLEHNVINLDRKLNPIENLLVRLEREFGNKKVRQLIFQKNNMEKCSSGRLITRRMKGNPADQSGAGAESLSA